MTSDVLKWVILTIWPLIAFTSCFTVLFREPYGSSTRGGCDVDYDVEFEQWASTFSILIEVILIGGASLDCIRASSVPVVAWILMIAYLIVTVVMLLNLLIAMSNAMRMRCNE